MKVLGYVVVIKRTGADGTPYPMVHCSCSIGRNNECDIRVQLTSVSQQQCRIDVDPSGKAYLTNLSHNGQTMLGDRVLAPEEVCYLSHKQVLSAGERKFRWEYPEGSPLVISTPIPAPTGNIKILVPVDKSPLPYFEEGWTLDEASDARRKKVSFGPQLNPEHFDKFLPPSTPIRKGEKPNNGRQSLDAQLLSSQSYARKPLRGGESSEGSSCESIPESAPDTPTKSLLRRRSPTPVKPYLARSLGITLGKLQGEQQSPPQTSSNTVASQTPQAHSQPVDKSAAVSTPRREALAQQKLLTPVANTPKPGVTNLVASPKLIRKAAKSPKVLSSKITHLKSVPSPAVKPSTPGSGKKSPTPRGRPRKSPIQDIGPVASPRGRPKKSQSPSMASPSRRSPSPSPKAKLSTPSSLGRPKKLPSPSKIKSTPSPRGRPPKKSISPSPKAPSGSPKPKLGRPRKSSSPDSKAKATPSPKLGRPKKKSPVSASPKIGRPRKSPLPAAPAASPSSNKGTNLKKSVSPGTKGRSPATSPSPRGCANYRKLKPLVSTTSPKTPGSPLKRPSSSSPASRSPSPKKKLQNESTDTAVPASPPHPAKATPNSPPSSKYGHNTLSPAMFPSPKFYSKVSRISSPGNASPKFPTPRSSPKYPASKLSSSPLPHTPKLLSPKHFAAAQSPMPISQDSSPASYPPSPKFASPRFLSSKLSSPKFPSPRSSSYSSYNSAPKRSSPRGAKSPKAVTSPRATTTPRFSSPRATNTPKQASPKLSSPRATTSPKQASPKLSSPRANTSPKPATPKLSSPRATTSPKPATSPRTTTTPKEATPKLSPKSTPKSLGRPKFLATPKSVTPRSKKMATPKSVTPRSKKMATPKSVTPRSGGRPKKQATPKSATPKRISAEKLSTPKSAITRTPKFASPEVLATPGSSTSWFDGPGKLATPKFSSPEVIAAPSSSAKPKKSMTSKYASYYTDPTVKLAIMPRLSTTPKSPKASLLPSPKPRSSKSPGNKRSLSDSLKKSTPKKLKTDTPKNRKSLGSAHQATPPKSAGKRLATPTSARTKKASVKSSHKKVTINAKSSGFKSGLSRVMKAKTPLKRLGQTPKKSFADVLKKGLAGKGAALSRSQKARAVLTATRNMHRPAKRTVHHKKTRKAMSTNPWKATSISSTSTGHANSPAPIIIHRKTTKTPKVFRRGQKQPLDPITLPGAPQDDSMDLEGLSSLLATPQAPPQDQKVVPSPRVKATPRESPAQRLRRGVRGSPSSSSVNSSTISSATNITNFDFSSIKTPEITKDLFVSSLETPAPCHTPDSVYRSAADKQALASPLQVPIEADATTFDFGSTKTPDVTQDKFISPVRSERTSSQGTKTPARGQHIPRTAISTPKPQLKNVTPLRNLPGESPLEKRQEKGSRAVSLGESTSSITAPSPQADYTNVAGLRRLVRTPKATAASPQADYTNVAGVKQLLKTPRPTAETPEPDYTNVAGVGKLLRTPRPPAASPEADYTNVAGVGKMLRTPKPIVESPQADYTNVAGVKKLLRTPRLRAEHPEADYTNVAGVKKIMRTPRALPVASTPEADYTNVAGMKKLMRTPRPSAASPQPDYTNVAGVAKLLKTPRPIPDSPKADYTNVAGVGKLLRSPTMVTASPIADYTNVAGVRHLMRSPKTPANTPEADYTGVALLLTTPEAQLEGASRVRKTPLTDQTNVDLIHSPMRGMIESRKSLQKESSLAASSPSENIPPQVQEEQEKDISSRKSERNPKAGVESSEASPVRQMRTRKKIEDCVLELVQSPVGIQHSLLSTPLGATPTPTRKSNRTASKKAQADTPKVVQEAVDNSTENVDVDVKAATTRARRGRTAKRELSNEEDIIPNSPAKNTRGARATKRTAVEPQTEEATEEAPITPTVRGGRGRRAAAAAAAIAIAEETPTKENEIKTTTVQPSRSRRGRGKEEIPTPVLVIVEDEEDEDEEKAPVRARRTRKVVDYAEEDVDKQPPKKQTRRAAVKKGVTADDTETAKIEEETTSRRGGRQKTATKGAKKSKEEEEEATTAKREEKQHRTTRRKDEDNDKAEETEDADSEESKSVPAKRAAARKTTTGKKTSKNDGDGEVTQQAKKTTRSKREAKKGEEDATTQNEVSTPVLAKKTQQSRKATRGKKEEEEEKAEDKNKSPVKKGRTQKAKGKGVKFAAEEEEKNEDNAEDEKVPVPAKRGRKTQDTRAKNSSENLTEDMETNLAEDEEEEEKPVAKKGRVTKSRAKKGDQNDCNKENVASSMNSKDEDSMPSPPKRGRRQQKTVEDSPAAQPTRTSSRRGKDTTTVAASPEPRPTRATRSRKRV